MCVLDIKSNGERSATDSNRLQNLINTYFTKTKSLQKHFLIKIKILHQYVIRKMGIFFISILDTPNKKKYLQFDWLVFYSKIIPKFILVVVKFKIFHRKFTMRPLKMIMFVWVSRIKKANWWSASNCGNDDPDDPDT